MKRQKAEAHQALADHYNSSSDEDKARLAAIPGKLRGLVNEQGLATMDMQKAKESVERRGRLVRDIELDMANRRKRLEEIDRKSAAMVAEIGRFSYASTVS